MLLARMGWALRQDDLERRAHLAVNQMAGERRAVAAPQHAMDMERGLAVGAEGDVPGQRRYLDLLRDRVALVLLGLPVELAERR
jgi:hypothetical protein